MVARGNTDKHRYSYSGGVKAQETEKWGRAVAEQRYGKLPTPNMSAADRSMPQDPEAKRGADWADDHPKDWVRGYGKNGSESAEGYPNFDPYKGKR